MIDLASKDQLLMHLKSNGLFAKKVFGQNFLIDSKILDEIVHAANLNRDDMVIEVGPGPGVLSQRLAPLVGHLRCVEIDTAMIKPWSSIMSAFPNAEISNEDVLYFTPPETPYKLVANIPYYITSPILKHFLRKQSGVRPDVIVLMIQKEVAQRICDKKKPTLLSWEIRIFGEPEVVCKVPPASFYPSPKVDSAVLRINVYDKPLLKESDMEPFFKLLGQAYKQPRKTLMNNLLASGVYSKGQIEEFFHKVGIDEKIRPHQLTLEHWNLFLAVYTTS
jgi:16S rRNA (adenine1518-N6/adenine1519-N6)-dimethyltransferase